MRYWINPNRPDRVYRTNEVTCWSRLVSGGEWVYHDARNPALPNEWRYEVTEEELERKAA
jgi:hypothetical protein